MQKGDKIKLITGKTVIIDEVFDNGTFRAGYTIYGQEHIKVDKKPKKILNQNK